MSVSTKELFTAFFKGLAFAKGLNFGEKNRGMAEDRWITIHPGGDLDVNRRIEIDDDGYILKGFGNKIIGTNLKDLSANLKAVKKGEQPIKMDKDGNRITEQEKPKSLPQQIRASQRDIEAENKNREFVNKVKDTVVKTPEQEQRYNQYKDDVVKILDKYGTTPQDRRFIQEEFIKSVADRYFSTPMSDLIKHLESVSTEEAWQERKQKYDDDVESVRKSLDELKEKLNSYDVKDRRKSKYLNDIERFKENLGKYAWNTNVGLCRSNIDKYESTFKSEKEIINRDLFRLANKWLRENEYMNYKIGEAEQKASESLAERRKERVEGMKERADKIKEAGEERFHKGFKMITDLPPGQPNIEGRLTGYLNRADQLMRSGNEEIKRGERLERRSRGAEEALSNMRSDDPAIIPKLQEAIRNSTDNAERQRLRERLDTAIRTHERNQSGGGLNKKTKLYDLEENVTDGRIRFRFDGKPRQEVIDIMKSRGFKWSPSNKAWQRQNTPNGVWSAKKVMEELKQFE